MTHHRKLAYNYLLYWAMLEIRHLEWVWHRPFELHYLSPLHWRRSLRAIRYRGALADALHNLAFFAAHDYEGFEEESFWSSLENLEKHEAGAPRRYRALFEQHLHELETGQLRKT